MNFLFFVTENQVIRHKGAEAQRTEGRGWRTDGAGGGGQVGNGLTLKVLRKHIKRLVNYAEAGDGEKKRYLLKRTKVVSLVEYLVARVSSEEQLDSMCITELYRKWFHKSFM